MTLNFFNFFNRVHDGAVIFAAKNLVEDFDRGANVAERFEFEDFGVF